MIERLPGTRKLLATTSQYPTIGVPVQSLIRLILAVLILGTTIRGEGQAGSDSR